MTHIKFTAETRRTQRAAEKLHYFATTVISTGFVLFSFAGL